MIQLWLYSEVGYEYHANYRVMTQCEELNFVLEKNAHNFFKG